MSPPTALPRIALLGDPDDRRAHMLQSALARLGRPPAALLSWAELLQGRPLASILTPDTLLRVDSPGPGLDVHRLLLARGAAAMAREPGERLSGLQAAALPDDGSGLRFARQRHLGLLDALRDLEDQLGPHAIATPTPADVALMCDKALCHAHLDAAGLQVAPALRPEGGAPWTAEGLRSAMDARNISRSFIKLKHGSSAAGVAALDRGQDQEALVTTVAMSGGEVFSALRLRRYTERRQIDAVLGWLFGEGAHVERWMPKARVEGREFDLRVVVMAGRARHVVARVSGGGPMTNLHLGNARGDLEAARSAIGEAAWAESLALAERAAGAFPETLCVGIDLMQVDEGGALTPTLIEVNAFGDLLPGVTWRGMDTYEAWAAASTGWFAARRG